MQYLQVLRQRFRRRPNPGSKVNVDIVSLGSNARSSEISLIVAIAIALTVSGFFPAI